MYKSLELTLENRMDKLVFTWEDLLIALKKLTPEELKQSVQIFPPHNTPDPVKLMPVLGIGTVDYFGEKNTKSNDDFKHHPEQVVLLTDHHRFSDDGDTYYTLQKDGTMIGNVSGKKIPLLKKKKTRKKSK